MQNSAAAGRLIIFFFGFLVLAGALAFGTMISGEEYQTMALIVAVTLGIVLYFFAGKYFWAICFASIFIPINIPFVPLGMKPFEIMLLAGLAYYAVNEMVFKKNWPKVGVLPDGLFLGFALVVVLYHGLEQRFGVRLLGSEVWGGRAYLSILAAGIAYYCLQSQKAPLNVWNKIPWIILLFASGNFLISLVENLFPGRLSFLAQNTEIIQTELARWGFLGNYGVVLMLTALASKPIHKLLTSTNMLPAVFLGTGYLLSLLAGYRSSFMNSSIVFMIAAFRDFRFKSSVFIILLLFFLGAISIINSSIYRLPPGVQRGLLWIPGEWDYDIVQDAAGSDDFRWKTWEYFWVHEFPDHMWLGRGLAVPYRELLTNLGSSTVDPETGVARQVMEDRDYGFFISGNLHNGFLSVLDRFGIVGGIFIFAFAVVAFMRFFNFLLRNTPSQQTFALHWIALYGCMYCISYPIGALRVDDFLPTIIMLLGVFNALAKSLAAQESTGISQATIPLPFPLPTSPETAAISPFRRP